MIKDQRAMAAGVSDRLWEIGDIVKLVEDAEAAPGKRGPYRAYPVETHTHYMLGVHSNGRRRRTLDVVGVGDNRTGTVRIRKRIQTEALPGKVLV